MSNIGNTSNSAFDLFRVSKAKETVDICPNTIRKYNRSGLRIYKIKGDRCAYVSRNELANFITTNAEVAA